MTRQIQMQPFNFKVVPTDDENAHVPVSVAGQTMVDVQNLISDIGAMMVRQELRLQNAIPASLTDRFDLTMGSASGTDVGASSDREDTLMLDALNQLYGRGDDLKRFRLTRRDAVREVAEDTAVSFQGAVIGTISQDPVRRNRWLISNGRDSVPITFASNISSTDIPLFAEAGPLIASGTVVTGEDGEVREMRAVVGCYSFPTVKFHRIITADRDIVLLNPVEANPGYNAKKGMWTLDCEALGISESKPSWDECVIAFHEYFTFLFETYAETDDEFEGEEKEIRDLLLSMVPVTV